MTANEIVDRMIKIRKEMEGLKSKALQILKAAETAHHEATQSGNLSHIQAAMLFNQTCQNLVEEIRKQSSVLQEEAKGLYIVYEMMEETHTETLPNWNETFGFQK